MLSAVKVFLFLSSSSGYVYMFKKKLKLSLYYTPVLVIAFISLFMFLGGLLGFLKQTSYVVLALGLLCFGFMLTDIIKKKTFPFISFSADLCGVILAFGTLVFTLLALGFKLLHYDNFSHWAVIVKYLLSADSFPETDTKIVVFLDYPPGTAVFIYYVCRFLGNSQGVMLSAQNIMLLSCFYCLFGIVKEKRRFLVYSFLGMGCAQLSYLNLTIRINNLLVDFLLPLLSLASIAASYRYKDRPILISLYNFFLLGFVSTVKSTGIVFALIAFVYYLFVVFSWSFREKRRSGRFIKRLKGFMLLLLTSAGMCAPYGLWVYRMNTVFSDYESKFDIDTQQMGGQYSAPVKELHRQITDDFLKASFDLDTRAAQVFFICNILVIIAVIFVRVRRKKKWSLGKLLLLSDIMVVLYYIGILYMYLYSMPEEEAVVLAGFDRYACSIMTLFAGILIIGAAIDIEKTFSVAIEERGAYKAYSSPSSKRFYQYGVLLTLVLGINFIYSEINGLISIREDHMNTLPGKAEELVGDMWTQGGKENEAKYLVAASDMNGQVSSGEVRYVCRYFLYSPNVEVTERLRSENLQEIADKYDYILVLDKSAVDIENSREELEFLTQPGLYSTSYIEQRLYQ